MNDYGNKTALVTGANSGIGFEAAAQLAEAGWGRVILACRTEARAQDARTSLSDRTGNDPFELLAVDTSEVGSANEASDQLRQRDANIDFLLLNAGASAPQYPQWKYRASPQRACDAPLGAPVGSRYRREGP